MTNLYYHVFFRWWKPEDIEELGKLLGENYEIIEHKKEPDKTSVSLYYDDRDEVEVKSENMVAFLSKFRAVLSQVKEGAITLKGIELRDAIKEHYPRDRPTPFPWEWNTEPSLRTE